MSKEQGASELRKLLQVGVITVPLLTFFLFLLNGFLAGRVTFLAYGFFWGGSLSVFNVWCLGKSLRGFFEGERANWNWGVAGFAVLCLSGWVLSHYSTQGLLGFALGLASPVLFGLASVGFLCR